jgi:hypothetical protein
MVNDFGKSNAEAGDDQRLTGKVRCGEEKPGGAWLRLLRPAAPAMMAD